MSDSFTVLPEELLGIVVENLPNDADRFGSFGRVCKKFAGMSYSMPYPHLFVRDYVNPHHKPYDMFHRGPPSGAKPKKVVNFLSAPSFSRIDKKTVERITVSVAASTELIKSLVPFVNVKKMEFKDLGRLHQFDFRVFTKLKDLDIGLLDSADSISFPPLERLRIAVKHTSNYGGRRAMFIPSYDADNTSKFISTMTSLRSLELGQGFYVDQKDLPDCKNFHVPPTSRTSSFPGHRGVPPSRGVPNKSRTPLNLPKPPVQPSFNPTDPTSLVYNSFSLDSSQ